MRGARYSAKRTEGPNGKVYHSKREAIRACDLHLLQKIGAIKNLREQVPYVVVPKMPGERAVTYRADFVYEEDGVEVVEDVKGHRTQLYDIKRKLMKHVHGITVRETA